MSQPVSARVLAAGEALVDWVSTERGADLATASAFTKAAGGAPMNVAVGLARLGVPVAFAGAFGDDPFGAWLQALLAAEGVDLGLARVATGCQTRMAYVVTNERGDRELAAFSTTAVADTTLRASDLPEAVVRGMRVLVYGSLPLTDAGARAALHGAADAVMAAGGLVVFDPNIRPVLWPDEALLREALEASLRRAHVVKLGLEELSFLCGHADLARGARDLLADYGLVAVVVTDGAAGSWAYAGNLTLHEPARAVAAIDPTGAGDGFVAGLIAGLLARDTDEALPARVWALGPDDWQAILREANAIGALVTTRTGAIGALPKRRELEAFLASGADTGPARPQMGFSSHP